MLTSKWILFSMLLSTAFFLSSGLHAQSTFLGMDRNDYPGDANMRVLKKAFAFTGYWLNNPPGTRANSWIGHREALQKMGYGFLVLFNGREYKELKSSRDAARVGSHDAELAARMAQKEGFPRRAIIFLDQEQGGRMLPEQKAYIYSWVDEVNAAGFQAGIYCSGIAAQESPGVSVVTADDIRENAGSRRIVFFVSDDACPPSPGCAFPSQPPSPTESGIRFADIWQFAQSPKRRDVAAGCPANYHPDGSCYPPGITSRQGLYVDVETASTPDPSQARTP